MYFSQMADAYKSVYDSNSIELVKEKPFVHEPPSAVQLFSFEMQKSLLVLFQPKKAFLSFSFNKKIPTACVVLF
jgi:hypothetical protein